jgi:hypothetical protein
MMNKTVWQAGRGARAFLVMAAVLVVLAGCIRVGDFAAAWDAGTIDPALAGRWLMTPAASLPEEERNGITERHVLFVRAGDHYEMTTREGGDEPMFVKTLAAGGQTFLMLYEPPAPAENAPTEISATAPGEAPEGGAPALPEIIPETVKKSGDLWPYRVAGGRLEFIRIAPGSADRVAELSGGLITAREMEKSSEFTINVLDAAAIAALGKIAEDPALWEVWASGTKEEGTEKAPLLTP